MLKNSRHKLYQPPSTSNFSKEKMREGVLDVIFKVWGIIPYHQYVFKILEIEIAYRESLGERMW